LDVSLVPERLDYDVNTQQFTQIVTGNQNVIYMARELRDERGGHNIHDVHIIGITATGLAKNVGLFRAI